MGKLGGLEQLVRLLGPEQPPGVQAGAAHALGTAAANNAALQALLLSSHRDVFQRLAPVRSRCIACMMRSAGTYVHVTPKVYIVLLLVSRQSSVTALPLLGQIVGSADPAAAAKALYCAAGLARGSEQAAQLLLDAGGLGTAVALLGAGPSGAPRPAALRRKALSLLADLAHAHAQARAAPCSLRRAFARSKQMPGSARLGARCACRCGPCSLVSLLGGSLAHVCIFWVASGLTLQAIMSKHMEAAGDAASVTAAVRGQLATAAADQDWDTAERALLALRALTAVPAVAKHLHVRLPYQTGTTCASLAICRRHAGTDLQVVERSRCMVN